MHDDSRDEGRDGLRDATQPDRIRDERAGGDRRELREARLRPEYAAHYPGVEPGRWMPALQLVSAADHEHSQGRARLSAEHRLPNEHFDFRGGRPRGSETHLRTRAADPDVLH